MWSFDVYRNIMKFVNWSMNWPCFTQCNPMHPEGTSIGSDNCDFSKNSDYNGWLWNINFLSPKPHEWYHPVQRRSQGNIYIEKFTNIGRSELCWDISGLFLDDRYFWISVPLTHHYKKCPVMWMIIELISKNAEISLSSRNNPEMSQHSSDVPMLVNFSIYIFPWDLLWTGWYHLKY